MARSFPIPQPLSLGAQHGQTFPRLVELMQRLLAPDGCPWDREQTPESLRKYVLEEACEVIDAIDSGEPAAVCEELGDLCLQVVFLAELARQRGEFGPDDVCRAIVEKLVRRHPHVFAEERAETSEAVLARWETIKAEERGAERPRGLLDGIPRALPALLRAQTTSEKVAKVGFDWRDPSGSRAKVTEELAELDEAIAGGDPARIESELGDLLFALTNLARHHGVSAEVALRATSDRFRARFSHVEARVRERHGDWPRDARGKPTQGLTLEELDGYWDEAKARES